MKIVEQTCEWIRGNRISPVALQTIEEIGRKAYKSEDRITPSSAETFVRGLLTRGHESVIEHVWASMCFVTDRGVTHEMVRHRIASYTQESTRYCNYSKGKFGGVTFVLPVRFIPLLPYLSPDGMLQAADGQNEKLVRRYVRWWKSMTDAEAKYLEDVADGASPQEARDFLPNSLKTEIVMTTNMREWRHFFRLRSAKEAHPQMRALASLALAKFQASATVLFDDIVSKAA